MNAKPARRTAGDRRDEIVGIALDHFARDGFRGTSTEAIARAAGISQPYLFRLFGTKRELFLACCDACHADVRRTFETAADGVDRDERFAAMGAAYIDLLADRTRLLFQMQMYAACADEVVRDRVRAGYRDLVETVGRLSGAGPKEVWTFFGHGMLLNVVASLDLPAIAGDDAWAAAWTDAGAMTGYAAGRG